MPEYSYIQGLTHNSEYFYKYLAEGIASAKAEDVLLGKTYVGAEGKTLNGTMPNNGALNYTPSTSQQTIPAGYTSGGTVGAVTSAIDSNIQAENIKKDVTILGITGILEEGGSENIKLFKTQEDMEADKNPQENDLAVVYKNEIYVPSQGDTISSIMVMDTITLDTPVTTNKSLYIGNQWLGQLQCNLTSVNCNIQYSSMTGSSFTIEYNSSDGEVYKRIDKGEDRYSFSVDLTIPSDANEQILEFLTNGEVSFGGIYMYKSGEYIIAKSQLDNTADCTIGGKSFYGKNGVETGTLGNNVADTFSDTNAQILAQISEQYENMIPKVLTDNDKTIDKGIYFIPTKTSGTPLYDTSEVTDMSSMFSNCKNLKTIPLLNTTNVTIMKNMFYACLNLKTIPLIDTSNVEDMSYMFDHCENLTSIPQLDTSSVTNMALMFADCYKLTDIPQLDTSSVTNMAELFLRCRAITSITSFDTSNVTDIGQMFYGCTNLVDIPVFNTNKVTSMLQTFSSCPNLSNTSLNNILLMCINSNVTSDTMKTLKWIGLSSSQATTCETLSNYQDFIDAGWTTGY